jgi:RNA polymerase sigma-70 factor (ECF subfamily)
MAQPASSTQLQHLLDRLQRGDTSARDALVQHGVERFRLLARRMFRRQSDLRKLDETDDVLQKALVRLHRALATVRPPDVRAFAGLAARQIRWVLHDLASQAAAARRITYSSGLLDGKDLEQDEPVAPAAEPSDVLQWGEFHRRVESLPDEEREVFDVLFYEGMSQPEAAALLQTSLRTVKRRWQRARLMLREALQGEWPSLEDDGG